MVMPPEKFRVYGKLMKIAGERVLTDEETP